ncbi:hypothetical protein EDB86DRAFT_3241093 [Lactarius hatsudake]|nr:hypothetical protein EDB86DRAFT_3241093 [Lactarius hatsudake]
MSQFESDFLRIRFPNKFLYNTLLWALEMNFGAAIEAFSKHTASYLSLSLSNSGARGSESEPTLVKRAAPVGVECSILRRLGVWDTIQFASHVKATEGANPSLHARHNTHRLDVDASHAMVTFADPYFGRSYHAGPISSIPTEADSGWSRDGIMKFTYSCHPVTSYFGDLLGKGTFNGDMARYHTRKGKEIDGCRQKTSSDSCCIPRQKLFGQLEDMQKSQEQFIVGNFSWCSDKYHCTAYITASATTKLKVRTTWTWGDWIPS